MCTARCGRDRMHSVIVDAARPLYKLARAGSDLTPSMSRPVLHGEAMPLVKRNGHGALPDKDKNYRPSDKESFMSERQREYFREKLLAWREDILKEAKETLAHLQAENEDGHGHHDDRNGGKEGGCAHGQYLMVHFLKKPQQTVPLTADARAKDLTPELFY